LLDAQHIELLETCRYIQSHLETDPLQSWYFRQKLNELVSLLREHDHVEACTLQQRGQELPPILRIQRAHARQEIEALACNSRLGQLDPSITQRLLCNWIQYHF